MNYESVLIEYIKKNYLSLETDNIDGYHNIRRYTKPIMSNYVENGIAILLNQINFNKKFNYVIDGQFNVNGKIFRPDIVIYDDNNVIYGIVEIKTQLGYSGNFKKDDYIKRVKKFKTASKEGKLKLNKVNFIVSDNCKDFIVILMNANGHNNIINFDGLEYFVLFASQNNKKLWYDNLSLDFINKGNHGFEKFINFVQKIDN